MTTLCNEEKNLTIVKTILKSDPRDPKLVRIPQKSTIVVNFTVTNTLQIKFSSLVGHRRITYGFGKNLCHFVNESIVHVTLYWSKPKDAIFFIQHYVLLMKDKPCYTSLNIVLAYIATEI